MPRSEQVVTGAVTRATAGSWALRRRGVTSSCRSYTSLVIAAPTSAFEKEPYSYVLRIPLPGVLRHTLRWYLKDGTLSVSGDWEGGNESGAVFFGSVYRSVVLPPDAVPAGFETSLERGTFVVRVPRHTE